jgi:uncharacterized membrane protein
MRSLRNRLIAPAIIIVMTLAGLLAWPWLPDQVESHWGLSGEADATMDRTLAVVLLPAMTLGVWLLLVFLPRIDPRKQDYESFGGTYLLIVNTVVAFLGVIHLAVIANGLDWNVPVVRVILVAAGLEFAVIGNELGRLRPNWFAGIRTPWTLSDDEVWRRTHRVGGRLFVTLGLLVSLLAVFAPPLVVVIALLGGLAAAALGLIGYSYVLWRRRHRDGTAVTDRG